MLVLCMLCCFRENIQPVEKRRLHLLTASILFRKKWTCEFAVDRCCTRSRYLGGLLLWCAVYPMRFFKIGNELARSE